MAIEMKSPKIVYSCYYHVNRQGEQFVAEHFFSYQMTGTLTINDGHHNHIFRPGDFRFIRRNQLAKYVKEPPPNGEFKSLSIVLDQEALREVSREYGFTAGTHATERPILVLPPHPLYKGYMDSLLPYLDLSKENHSALLSLKVKEAILLLMKVHPSLKDQLFDFNEPGKIDLEAFMQQNFHFNVGLNRFAYLTGRSLATFKRDFEKIFHISPSRWLLQRRLEEAYYLIKERGRKPSDVYVDVGFEDLSHFSFAFKNAYGVAPSRV